MDERLNLHAFGPFSLDARNEVLLRDSERVPLQPQPMKVLLLLASRPGELVTRKELQSAVWSDGTHVDFDQGLNWCIKRIREVLGDDASHPRYIETVPRKGYRFLLPAHGEKVALSLSKGRMRGWATIALLAILCTVAASAWRPAPPVTVVILPFDNFTGDARNDLAATIATEEVINRVGSVDPARLKVIDRLTAAKFKRSNECIIHIGRQLRADFVMEGALQRHHATAALYRVADNTQVWATAVDPRVETASSLISNRIAATFR